MSPPASACWRFAKPSRIVHTRPPTRSRGSTTVTSAPIDISSYAAVSPARPAPATSTEAPARSVLLLVEAAEETGVIPSRTVGPVGDADGKPPDSVDVSVSGVFVDGLVHIVGRLMIALGRPFLRDGGFRRVQFVADLHGQRRNARAD